MWKLCRGGSGEKGEMVKMGEMVDRGNGCPGGNGVYGELCQGGNGNMRRGGTGTVEEIVPKRNWCPG